MKVAIVHDYIREYGGAERVLEALSEAFPKAPIYTAFVKKDGRAYKHFANKKIYESWAAHIPFFASKLHSPLRFLAPLIWGSFNFSEYDVVISSASWYITKGFGSRRPSPPRQWRGSSPTRGEEKKERNHPIEICYCHTPPRWLYGYKTSIEWQKYLPIKLYAAIVGHFMRIYDFNAAQRVDYFIANSKEVQVRIKKFYRRDATVIYPPVELPISSAKSADQISNSEKDYYFMVARLTGPKGLELAVKAAIAGGFTLKVAGVASGYYSDLERLQTLGKGHVEFLGYVTDEELVSLYSNANAFLALATDEDFGITPVESMLCGTPVIAYNGAGYKETVIDAHSASSGQGPTGVFFQESTVDSLLSAIKRFETQRFAQGKKIESACKAQAKKFSKERFVREIKEFVNEKLKANA
ncbi:MAG: glycosyltransferase [Candidatus Levybacteria bacterium]|nr:glycosyltransferase [Candidatus Levybacteria bacterium]